MGFEIMILSLLQLIWFRFLEVYKQVSNIPRYVSKLLMDKTEKSKKFIIFRQCVQNKHSSESTINMLVEPGLVKLRVIKHVRAMLMLFSSARRDPNKDATMARGS
jgi:hypothetical protein